VSVAAVQLDPAQAASLAQLRYVSDDVPGYRRRRCGRGFSYHHADGRLVEAPEQRAWIRSLRIPPAWEDVWISPYRNGHLLATGRDGKGRKQYIYHPRWSAQRAAGIFHQMPAFGQALPGLRARLESDLGQRGLGRERILALVVRLLDLTLVRVGNAEYAKRNDSFGLTTLRSRHLDLAGSRIRFEFRGKSGKQHTLTLRDRRLAGLIRRCQELPGQELFQYVDEAKQRHGIDSADVNAYLAEVTGQPFTAKCFRTWGGSVAVVEALHKLPPPGTAAEAEQRLRTAVDCAARRLGNTVAVCRRHYVHPAIAECYRAGRFFALCRLDDGGDGLAPAERALLWLLQASR